MKCSKYGYKNTIDRKFKFIIRNRRYLFNYKFNNSAAKIDEIESIPAYKRAGFDVTSLPNQNTTSRMSLGTDSNDDVQLRSNNSFLHDNVD